MGPLHQIGPGLLVATAELYVTNSTAVAGRAGGCLLVDPAVTGADLGQLAAGLRGQGLVPRAGFATHAHWDHLLWSAELGSVPRLGTARTVSHAQQDRTAMIASVQREAPGHDLDLFGQLTPLSPGQDEIEWDGPPVRVLTHEGHVPGHAALWLPESGALIAGDMLSDAEIPLLNLDAADPVGDYRAGLELLAGLPGVRVLIPGHGSIGDAAALRQRLAADFGYLNALERGRDCSDPRLGAGWLRAAHRRQLGYARDHLS